MALLTILIVVGCALAVAPVSLQSLVRRTVIELAGPGQIAVQRLVGGLDQHLRERLLRPINSVDRDAEFDAEMAAAKERIRKLEALLVAAGDREAALRASGPDLIRGESGEPLVDTSLLTATVLGTDHVDLLRSGMLVVREGDRDVRESSLVLDDPRPFIDQGEASGVEAGQSLLAGRCLVGRIVRSGRWISNVQPLTDPGFRGLARIQRPSEVGFRDGGEGLLEGIGDGTCRFKHLPATRAVSEGDRVYAAGGDALSPVPILCGTIVKAELPDGAPHWNIVVRPAVDWRRVKTVQVVRKSINPIRALAN